MGNSNSNISDWESKGFTMKDGRLVNKKLTSPTSKQPSIAPEKKSYNKYGNRKVVIDGFTFDSEKEGRYYQELGLLVKANEVSSFKIQVPMKIEVNGIRIATYILDFKVEYPNGDIEYVDVKAKKKDGKFLTTSTFNLKKKLVEAIYGIKLKLV